MIYITGDMHGDFGRFSNKRMKKKGIALGENDYMIVCGDFGLCWREDATFEYDCRNFAGKKYTVLWVQGNHENYDMIKKYPIEKWNGGKVRHIVRDKVILLERGQVFELEGKKIFTFGGAASHDMQGGLLNRRDCGFDEQRRRAIRSELPFRIIHESWWEEELPNEEEMQEGLDNLAKYDYSVDYVVTHCAPTQVQNAVCMLKEYKYGSDILTDYLQEIDDKLKYRRWYFGHYHEDHIVDERHCMLYYAMIDIESENRKIEGPLHLLIP